jgi:hypothetical protein
MSPHCSREETTGERCAATADLIDRMVDMKLDVDTSINNSRDALEKSRAAVQRVLKGVVDPRGDRSDVM